MPTGSYKRKQSFEERFARYVDTSGPVPQHCLELGPCHVWTGPAMKDGTGRLKVDGTMVLARRLVCEAPKGSDVSPLCRNAACVRRDHMHVGPRNSNKAQRTTEVLDKGTWASDDWRDIPGFPGYEASRFGGIRSWRHSQGGYAAEPKTLTQTPNVKSGYLYVGMINVAGEKKNCLVHLLVLSTWAGPCPPGEEARHFPDNAKSNNAIDNLSYTTHKRNMEDQLFHGTRPTAEQRSKVMREVAPRGDQHYARKSPEKVRHGAAHHNAKITKEMYDWAVELLEAKIPQKTIAKELGVSQSQISDIATGKRTR